MAARLFFVPALNLNFFTNGLEIRNPLFFEFDFGSKFCLQPADNNIKVLLTQAGKQLLP